ncbi:APC family permease [Paractinoplanes hotanensis]|uniref:APC family permease n=1 Tax=Paractinoplanes hotanensis TaxID=2906497 RepID=A0ABT0Y8V1_9ACTN|nr:APC family permease [Actinoplanes hotanensis]MCM4082220.1 APC family permease [Actinoplanes hotanensis]
MSPRGVRPLRAGLHASRLSAPRLFWYAIAAVTPLTIVISAVPIGFGQLEQIATPAGYLLAAAVLAVFSVGLSAVAQHVPNAGALYSYVAAVSKTAAVGTAVMALLAYATILIGLYGAFGSAVERVVHPGGQGAWWPMWAIGGWAVVTCLVQLNLRTNAIILGVLVAAEAGYVIAVDLVLLAHPADGYPLTALNPAPLASFTGLGSLMGAITGFLGFEIVLAFALVAVDPSTTVRRSIRAVLAVTGLLYGATAWIMTVAAGPDRIIALAQEHGPGLFFHLAAPYVPGEVIEAGAVLYAGGLFAAILAFSSTIGRYILTLAREGILPGWLAIIRGERVPVAAGLAQAALTLTVLALCVGAGVDPDRDLFFYATTAGGLGVLFCMTQTAIAVPVFLHRNPHGEPWLRRRAAPITAALLLAAITVLSAVLFGELVNTTSTIAALTPPVTYLSVIAVTTLWARWLRRHRPHVYQAIGHGSGALTPAAPELVSLAGAVAEPARR